jgi:hypothetical protein
MRKGIQRDLRRLTYLKNEIGQSSKLSAELFDHNFFPVLKRQRTLNQR